MIFSQTKKTILITGAAQGIGWATAEYLAQKNFDLILVDKQKNFWQKKAQKLAIEQKIKVQTFVTDLSQVSQIKKLASKLKNYKINVLINNAAVPISGELINYTDRNIQQALLVNLQAVILMTKYFLPALQRSRGLVINISSGAGLKGMNQFSVYSATKFAVIGFSKSLAKDLSAVKILSITPGATDTALFKKSFRDGRKPLYQPADIAQIIGETIINQKKYQSGEVIDRCEHLERK